LGNETLEGDPFLSGLSKRMEKIFGKEKKSQISEISVNYTYTNPETHKVERQETITLNLEQKLQEFISFYKDSNIDLPPNFENDIREIWERNVDVIEKSIEENGFDDILLIPGSISLPDLHSKMIEGYNPTYEGSNFTSGGSFAGAKSQNVDKIRIVLVHKTQNLQDRPELKKTLNIKGQDVKLDQALTLEDYLVFQRKYFKETGQHLDEVGWTWLATKAGARLVSALWDPGTGELDVSADALGYRNDLLGVRPSRCFS